MAASLLIGAGAAQSSWYPRSDNYTTTGWFVGDGLYLSGDGIIEGNLTVGGTIASSDTATIYDYLGDIANITTTATDVAAAINELDGEIGNFSAVTNVTSNESISAILDELAARIAVLETSG